MINKNKIIVLMLNREFNIPVLFFLIFLISKEIFSYESEKIVILCILTFVILAYYNLKEGIFKSLESKTIKLEDEFKTLFLLKKNSQKDILIFWRNYSNLKYNLLRTFLWISFNIKIFIKKINQNRSHFIFFLIKDELNFFLKDYYFLNHIIKLYLVKNSINNLKSNFKNLINSNFIYLNKFNINFMGEKLKLLTINNNILYLILNKLNINKKFNNSNNNWNDFNSFLLLKKKIII